MLLRVGDLMELVDSRRRKLKTGLRSIDMPKIHAFLSELAASKNWSKEATMRLCSAGEETVLSLIGQQKNGTAAAQDEDDDDDDEENKQRHLLITARGNNKSIELECIAAPGEENLEDRMVLLKEGSNTADESDRSF